MSLLVTEPRHSQEFQIDATVEDLIGKLVEGNFSPKDEATYNQLLAQRSRMMRPAGRTRNRRR